MTLPLDRHGLPLGHAEAADAAKAELLALVNELPESFYHLGPTDAEWITDNVLWRYLHTLKQAQRPALTLIGGKS